MRFFQTLRGVGSISLTSITGIVHFSPDGIDQRNIVSLHYPPIFFDTGQLEQLVMSNGQRAAGLDPVTILQQTQGGRAHLTVQRLRQNHTVLEGMVYPDINLSEFGPVLSNGIIPLHSY